MGSNSEFDQKRLSGHCVPTVGLQRILQLLREAFLLGCCLKLLKLRLIALPSRKYEFSFEVYCCHRF
jgi:hypothetical protein